MAVHLARLVAADGNRNVFVGPIVMGEHDERPLVAIPDQRHLDPASAARLQIDQVPHGLTVFDPERRGTGRAAESN